MEHRSCNTCGEVKALADFAKDASKKDGIRGRCKVCQRDYWSSWKKLSGNTEKSREAVRRSRIKNIDQRTDYARQRFYGLKPGQAALMLESQGGACAICEDEITLAGPTAGCVDHDHVTGAVRGFLCRRCNSGLGMFRDDHKKLLRAVEYLETDWTRP